MGRLTIYQDNYTDSTVISNRFIDEYMMAANDAQLKIYLYLIRMMSAKRSTSISDIADMFNYTEKDVLRALKYWEKKQLLRLDCDENKTITGIHLLDFAAEAPAKPNYTLDELKEFKSNEATSRILFFTEQYLKKTLSSSEMRTMLFISDKLGFSEDLIDYLIQYCAERGKKDLKYIEKVAISWAEQGITTPEEACAFANKYDKTVYAVMKALGKTGIPTHTEVAFITRWTKEYGFTPDIIHAACERTVLATDKHRFEYADGILTSWYKSGVHHINDIASLDSAYRKNKSVKAATVNKFNQFKQNDYDFDALEQELLSN